MNSTGGAGQPAGRLYGRPLQTRREDGTGTRPVTAAERALVYAQLDELAAELAGLRTEVGDLAALVSEHSPGSAARRLPLAAA